MLARQGHAPMHKLLSERFGKRCGEMLKIDGLNFRGPRRVILVLILSFALTTEGISNKEGILEAEEDKDPGGEILEIEVITEAEGATEVEMDKEIRTYRIKEMTGDNRVNRALSCGHTVAIASVDIVENVGRTTWGVILAESRGIMLEIAQTT